MCRDFFSKILILALTCCCLCCCTMKYTQEDLVGTWEGKNDKVEMTITFDQKSTCSLIYIENNKETLTLSGNIEVDFSKKPVPLTIRNIPVLNYPLHTIIEFVDADVIRMSSFAPRWRLRPITFEKDTEIILKRVKAE